MTRFYYPVSVLVLGLFTAQVLSTIHVYLSNADLYRTVAAISHAGYLVIPTQKVTHSLQELRPAFFGGLFFTLSAGAGLSIFTLAAFWIWDRIFSRNRLFLIPFLLLWAGCLMKLNSQGFSLMPTSYFLTIPSVVFVAALIWMPSQSGQKTWLNGIIHFAPVILLALLWTTQMGSHMFLDLRDNLLLSNPLGIKINDFYYKYTLYPARAFKSLDQKILKTCNLRHIKDESLRRSLEKELLNHDYLPVEGDAPVDLDIMEDGNALVFQNREKTILKTMPGDFLSGPGDVLKEFSLRSDKNTFFRHFTFYSLLVGLPITSYVILYALFRLIFCLFLPARTSSVIASILCLSVGIALLTPLFLSSGKKIEVKDLAQAMESKHWQKRVRALKTVVEEGGEIGVFPAYHKMITSPHIPERYWLVKALGFSRQSKTCKDLLVFLDDPYPNVVCMAFYALGQRGDRRAAKEIINRIETSENWYNQWYAYKALRALGWKQTRSE